MSSTETVGKKEKELGQLGKVFKFSAAVRLIPKVLSGQKTAKGGWKSQQGLPSVDRGW